MLMQTGTQANPIRFPKIAKKKTVTGCSPKPKPEVTKVLEESKRLESLYQKITKSTGRRIINYLSDYRRSASPCPIPTKSLSNPAETLLKLPQNSFKSVKNPSEICTELVDQPSIQNRKQKLSANESEFKDVDFKQNLWPEDAIMDDELYNAIIGSKKFEIDEKFKHSFNNRRIKSRIGEYSRKYNKREKRWVEESLKKSNERVSTPWTYSNDNEYACIFNPYY